MYLSNEKASLAIFSTDSGRRFGGDLGNNLGILMCGKGSHKSTFAYNIVSIQSLMTYTDIVE